MKTKYFILSSLIILCSCSGSSLTKEQAREIITDGYGLPKPFKTLIYTADPEVATQVKKASLDTKGFVAISPDNAGSIGKPLITFNNTSTPYLLEASPKEKQDYIQPVKVAETELGSITEVLISQDGNSATVNWEAAHKNLTPFSALVHRDFNKQDLRTTKLVRTNEGWKIQ